MKKILALILAVMLCTVSVYAASDRVKGAYLAGGEYLLTLNPAFGSEWNVLGLARGGAITKEYKDAYYHSVISKLRETDGEVGKSATDYAKVIIGISAVGRNAANAGGYNLIEKLTQASIEKQGLNGAVYALLALDCKQYASEVSREWLVDTVLASELDGGGWTFWGNEPDPDMTSMAITALAPYYNTDEEAKAAIECALVWLSEVQCESGAYSSYGSECPESSAQVLVALTAMGIDPDSDERFIKNKNTIPEAIAQYATEDGGFAHSIGTDVNSHATQQAYYALAAYYRYKDGKTSLYDMSDLKADISVSSENGNITYINNGTASANALSIIASYDSDGRLTKTNTASVEIAEGEEYKTEIAQGEEAFLWNILEPLCTATGD